MSHSHAVVPGLCVSPSWLLALGVAAYHLLVGAPSEPTRPAGIATKPRQSPPIRLSHLQQSLLALFGPSLRLEHRHPQESDDHDDLLRGNATAPANIKATGQTEIAFPAARLRPNLQ